MSIDPLTAIGLGLTAGMLFYQARAYHLTRRELSLKVKEVSELVHRLEGEINERKLLHDKLENLGDSQLTQYVEALNYTSALGDTHQETYRGISRRLQGSVSDIQHALLALNLCARSSLLDPDAPSTRLLDAMATFCKARLDQIQLFEEWDSEMESIPSRPTTGAGPDLEQAWTEHLSFMRASIARLEGKYSDRVQALNRNLTAARAQFMALLEAQVGERRP